MKDAWNPEQYDRFKTERSAPFHDLRALIEPGSHFKIIDLGCGDGTLTSELHHSLQANETLGIDASIKMITTAKKFESNELKFKVEDINDFNQNEKFDLIFSNAALQWCEDHPLLFACFSKSLKTGGQLAIQMPLNHDYPTHTLASEMSLEPKWLAKLNGQAYTQKASLLLPEEYAKLLFDLKFKEQKVLMRVYDHVFPDRTQVVEWVKGTLLTHFSSRLTAEDFAVFLSEFKNRLDEVLPDDRPFFYPFKRLLLWAKR